MLFSTSKANQPKFSIIGFSEVTTNSKIFKININVDTIDEDICANFLRIPLRFETRRSSVVRNDGVSRTAGTLYLKKKKNNPHPWSFGMVIYSMEFYTTGLFQVRPN
jgi:hypothetical protein